MLGSLYRFHLCNRDCIVLYAGTKVANDRKGWCWLVSILSSSLLGAFTWKMFSGECEPVIKLSSNFVFASMGHPHVPEKSVKKPAIRSELRLWAHRVLVRMCMSCQVCDIWEILKFLTWLDGSRIHFILWSFLDIGYQFVAISNLELISLLSQSPEVLRL